MKIFIFDGTYTNYDFTFVYPDGTESKSVVGSANLIEVEIDL